MEVDRKPEPLCVRPRERKCLWVCVGGVHLGVRAGVLDREGDGPAPRAHIQDPGGLSTCDRSQGERHQALGLGSGEEDPGPHLEPEPEKLHLAQDQT